MNIWRIDGGAVRLSLHQGQTRAWNSEKRFVFMLAGTQGGKTSFGPWWLWREIQRIGPGDYIAATASYDLFKLKMLPETRTVFESLLKVGKWWAGDKIIELKNPDTGKFQATRSDDPMWGRIILRSAASPGGLESTTAKAAWLDECGQDGFSLDVWEAVLRRLSLAQGRVFGSTTIYNLGWLKTEIYDPWQEGDPDIDVIQFSSIINPAFPEAEFRRAEGKMQDWRFLMFYRGEFATPAGLIYKDFKPSMLVDPFPISPEWERVVGLDFGPVNTVKLYLALNPADGRWYAHHGIHGGEQDTAGHVAQTKRHLPPELSNVTAVGGAKSEKQQRMDWQAAGLRVEGPPIADVESGIDRVTTLLKTDRLRVFRNLKGLRDEFGRYSRKVDENGAPTDVIERKSEFHWLDALRYAASYIVGGTKAGGYVQDVSLDDYKPERRSRLW